MPDPRSLLQKRVFSPGMCEPREESPGSRSVAATIAPLASLSAPKGKVTASPGEDCPTCGRQGRWDGDEAGRAWQPGWDQKQEPGVKAKRSKARSQDSWGCPKPKAGN